MSTPETAKVPSTDPEQIEKEIARHRAELGATVDEPSGRLDVTRQAKRQMAQVRATAAEGVELAADNAKVMLARARKLTPKQWALSMGAVLAVVAGIIVVLRRRSGSKP